MWVLLMFVIHHMHEKFISDMTEKVYQKRDFEIQLKCWKNGRKY